MITSNVIHRVFRIRLGDAEGTAFSIDVDQRQYLVTARHIAQVIQGAAKVGLFGNGVRGDYGAQLVGHASGDTDVSVLSPDKELTPPALRLPATSAGLVYGQDVFFLGFPYGYVGKYVIGPEGFPLPFVKKAVVSLFDDTKYLLDGHNNPGFSGGPIVFHEAGTMVYKVAAVVSGFQATAEPVYAGDRRTPLTYSYNTGIIVAHRIRGRVRLD